MFKVNKDWNPRQAQLKQLLSDENKLKECIDLLLNMHALLHDAEVSNHAGQTFMDIIWEGLDQADFSKIAENGHSIAWNIWHITRIEDIAVNLLIAEQDEVLNDQWLARLGTSVRVTGNAMTPAEIVHFSQALEMQALRAYRMAVGRQTRKVIKEFQYSDLKRKVSQTQIKRVQESGGVIDHPDSIWLLDFWGKKTVAGLIRMPLTRHQVVHLNECQKILNY